MWRVPRVDCEQLNIKYPTIVYATVENVLYDKLHAIITVTGVQDDIVDLPDTIEVRIEDLYPCIVQENSALNIESTADGIDMLR